MKTLDAVIVDDEELARGRLSKMMSQLRPDWNLRQAESGRQALDLIRQKAPDLLLLDIQMPELNGFDVVKNISDLNISVIFQTAHDEFAVKAFEVAACDYLLKPFTAERLESALKRFEAQNSTKDGSLSLGFDASVGGWMKKICLRSHRDTLIYDVNQIESFSSRDHCTCVIIDHQEYKTELSLDRLESSLDPQMFFRSHRAHLVNLGQVAGWTNDAALQLKMNSGLTVPVSRRQVSEIKSRLKITAFP